MKLNILIAVVVIIILLIIIGKCDTWITYRFHLTDFIFSSRCCFCQQKVTFTPFCITIDPHMLTHISVETTINGTGPKYHQKYEHDKKI